MIIHHTVINVKLFYLLWQVFHAFLTLLVKNSHFLVVFLQTIGVKSHQREGLKSFYYQHAHIFKHVYNIYMTFLSIILPSKTLATSKSFSSWSLSHGDMSLRAAGTPCRFPELEPLRCLSMFSSSLHLADFVSCIFVNNLIITA